MQLFLHIYDKDWMTSRWFWDLIYLDIRFLGSSSDRLPILILFYWRIHPLFIIKSMESSKFLIISCIKLKAFLSLILLACLIYGRDWIYHHFFQIHLSAIINFILNSFIHHHLFDYSFFDGLEVNAFSDFKSQPKSIWDYLERIIWNGGWWSLLSEYINIIFDYLKDYLFKVDKKQNPII